MKIDAAITELTECAASWTGFSRDAILKDSIRRAIGSADPGEMLRRARLRDPALVHLLCQAVSVGETFLFRHPEQFRYLASQFVPRRIERGATRLRAWSAGCATGEEAYSIAACLLDGSPLPSEAIEVLGTDLVERNLEKARAAEYGVWSRRASGPILHPVGQVNGDRLRVDDRLRGVTRFELHNLLHAPPPGGPFDVIFCRNALVYFAPEPSRTVVLNLVSALAPEGLLCFGPMDLALAVPPPGLVSASKPEDQIWRRPEPSAPRDAKPLRRPAPPATPLPAPRGVPPPEPVALHLHALRHIERGERQVADHALGELCRLVPDYVPGLVEHALLKLRNGEQTAAAALMRQVLRRLDKLPADELVPGPEPLPVGFYRESAGNCLRGAAR